MQKIYPLLLILLCFFHGFGCLQNTKYNTPTNEVALGIEHELIFIFDRQLSVAEILAAQDDAKLSPIANQDQLKPFLQSRGFLKVDIESYLDVESYLDILLFPARGFEVGEIVMVDGKKQVITQIDYDYNQHREILTLDNGDKAPCGSPEKRVTYENFPLEIIRNKKLFFYNKRDRDETSVLLEFMYPPIPSFSQNRGFDNFIDVVQGLKRKQDAYRDLIDRFLKQAARQFQNYEKKELEKDEHFSRLSVAYRLFKIKEKYQLTITPAPFDTLYGLTEFKINTNNHLAYYQIPQQVGSIQTAITLPQGAKALFILKDKSNIDPSKTKKMLEESLYTAFILQWTEPLWIATRTSGNLEEGIAKGVHGSYRLQVNQYTQAGSVPLRICELQNPNVAWEDNIRKEKCLSAPSHSYMDYSRTSLLKQCYTLIQGEEEVYYSYPYILIRAGQLDFKGKSFSPNVFNFLYGFEYRIFGNQPIEKFISTLEIIALLTAHAETTFKNGIDLQNLEYINIDNDELAKSKACRPCQGQWWGLSEVNKFPCNSWQITMAAVFEHGYRAELDIAFVKSLEKNIALDFWHKDDAQKIFAFEIAEQLTAELYRLYKDHPTVAMMMGSTLKSKPAIQRLSLEEWSFYFNDPLSPWNSKRETFLKSVKEFSNQSMFKKVFIEELVSKYFDASWKDAYDDILFMLDYQGLIKLVYDKGSIEGIDIL